MSLANIPARKNGKDASKSASRRTSNLIYPPRTKASVSNLIRDTNRMTLVYCLELRSCRSSRTRSFALKSVAIVSILPLFEWCFTGSNTNEHRVVKFVETRLHEKLVFLSFLSSFSPLLFSGRTSKEQIGPGQWGTRIDDGINGRSPLIRNSRLRFIWLLLFTNFWQLPTTDPEQRSVALHCHIMISLLLSLFLFLPVSRSLSFVLAFLFSCGSLSSSLFISSHSCLFHSHSSHWFHLPSRTIQSAHRSVLLIAVLHSRWIERRPRVNEATVDHGRCNSTFRLVVHESRKKSPPLHVATAASI